MKIALISPGKAPLDDMRHVLQAQGHMVHAFHGGKSQMRAVVEQERPELLLVDGMCRDPNELALVEYVTTHYPQTAVILLCAAHTPEFLLNAMRAGVREVLPSPVTAGVLEAAVQRVSAKLMSSQSPPTAKVLAFIACKGGSGATFLATNLAHQLSDAGSVLLIDLNLQFGDALAFVSDAKPHSTLAEVARDIGRLDASLLAASTVKVTPRFHVLAAPEDPALAMGIRPEHIDAILNVAVQQHDFVVLDLARTLDPVSVRALDRADHIFPVLQASVPGIRNASKLLGVFKSLGYPPEKVELVVNRFEKTGAISLSEIRRTLDHTALRAVADAARDVEAAVNRGLPLLAVSRSNPVARNLAEFASALAPRPEEKPGILSRLFGMA